MIHTCLYRLSLGQETHTALFLGWRYSVIWLHAGEFNTFHYHTFIYVVCALKSNLYLYFSALRRLSVACSFHHAVYGRVSLLWLHATWTKTLWAIYSGAGELSLPWTPASSGTPKAVISLSLCRLVALLHKLVFPLRAWTDIYWTVVLCTHLFLYCNSWEFHIRSSWWATSTNFRMMIRPRSRAQSSVYTFLMYINLLFLYVDSSC